MFAGFHEMCHVADQLLRSKEDLKRIHAKRDQAYREAMKHAEARNDNVIDLPPTEYQEIK